MGLIFLPHGAWWLSTPPPVSIMESPLAGQIDTGSGGEFFFSRRKYGVAELTARCVTTGRGRDVSAFSTPRPGPRIHSVSGGRGPGPEPGYRHLCRQIGPLARPPASRRWGRHLRDADSKARNCRGRPATDVWFGPRPGSRSFLKASLRFALVTVCGDPPSGRGNRAAAGPIR